MQRRKALNLKANLPKQASYVGTQNYRPGPSFQPSIPEEATKREDRDLHKKAAEKLNDFDIYTAEPLEIELVEWQKIETLKPLRLSGFYGLFLLTHESKEAVLLKS